MDLCEVRALLLDLFSAEKKEQFRREFMKRVGMRSFDDRIIVVEKEKSRLRRNVFTYLTQERIVGSAFNGKGRRITTDAVTGQRERRPFLYTGKGWKYNYLCGKEKSGKEVPWDGKENT